MLWPKILQRRGIAVVTGGASGVGLAAAKHLAQQGFEPLLVDLDADALDKGAQEIRDAGGTAHICQTDVSDAEAVARMADQAFDLGPVSVVMNNAGMATNTTCWSDPEGWRKIFDVNFFGIVNGVQAFVPRLIEAGTPAAIINTGSKQGITTPPGNPAYNASKAAVKVLTEQLAHELRTAEVPIDTHLFVPGFTYTAMIARIMPEKPAGAWTSEEAVDYLFKEVAKGTFYVLCPDNMVTEEIDAKRVLWNAQDIAERRPPLSRWHSDWTEAFQKFEKGDGS